MSGFEASALDIDAWATDNFSLFSGTFSEPVDVITTVGGWREAARESSGNREIELAGPFQRHLTARGTGLPSNFCLALTPAEVIAFKFDPRNQGHPIEVVPKQIKKEVARWPRADVGFSDFETGKMADGAILSAGGATIPCRTPRIGRNPGAAVVLHALGVELPST